MRKDYWIAVSSKGGRIIDYSDNLRLENTNVLLNFQRAWESKPMREILKIISKTKRPMSARLIEDATGINYSNLTRYLKELRESGILSGSVDAIELNVRILEHRKPSLVKKVVNDWNNFNYDFWAMEFSVRRYMKEINDVLQYIEKKNDWITYEELDAFYKFRRFRPGIDDILKWLLEKGKIMKKAIVTEFKGQRHAEISYKIPAK